MKRALLMLLSCMLLLTACHNTIENDKGSDHTMKETEDERAFETTTPIPETEDPYKDFIESDDAISKLENDELCVTIGKSGELLSITTKFNTVVYQATDTADSFSLLLNPDTDSIWDTDPAGRGNRILSEADAITKHIVEENKVEVISVIRLEKGTVALRKTYSLYGGDLKIEAAVENRLNTGVVIAATPVYLQGVTSRQKAMNCLWPYKTGTICKLGIVSGGISTEDGGTMLTESYPTPISMQLVTLYDDDKTISYTVEDTQATYKTFFYKSCANKSASVWCEQMPFTASRQQTTLAPVVISCFAEGDWMVAADRYQQFLINAGWAKSPTDLVKTFTGGNGWDLNVYLNNCLTKYVASAPANAAQTLQTSMRLILRRTGLRYMWITGWHEGGFDTYYPDYTFSQMMGGKAGFIQGLEELHAEGGKAIVYLNAHMSDIQSQWYNTENEDGIKNGEACATRKADGSIYEETYPTSGKAVDVAMCPASEAFQKAIVTAADKVRAAGADAIYLDQISEMRSYLCFDPHHGHTTPATAYCEGYSKLLNDITNVMERYGEDWFLLCEGVCDCYGKWIDIFCGYTDTNFLPLTRYTIPNKIVGRDLASENNDTYFSSAFVLGEPFICHRYHVIQNKYTNKNLRRYLSLYESNPNLYLAGKYVYRRGLSETIPARVDAGVIEGADGTCSAIHLYNTAAVGQARVTFTYTPPSGKVTRAYNAETGESLLTADGSIAITLNNQGTISVIVEY